MEEEKKSISEGVRLRGFIAIFAAILSLWRYLFLEQTVTFFGFEGGGYKAAYIVLMCLSAVMLILSLVAHLVFEGGRRAVVQTGVLCLSGALALVHFILVCCGYPRGTLPVTVPANIACSAIILAALAACLALYFYFIGRGRNREFSGRDLSGNFISGAISLLALLVFIPAINFKDGIGIFAFICLLFAVIGIAAGVVSVIKNGAFSRNAALACIFVCSLFLTVYSIYLLVVIADTNDSFYADLYAVELFAYLFMSVVFSAYLVMLYDNGKLPLVVHALAYIFFGIWMLVWVYITTRKLDTEGEEYRSPLGKTLLCAIIPFYHIYWMYRTAKATDNLAHKFGVQSELQTLCTVVEIFLPIVSSLIIQNKLNTIVDAMPQGGFEQLRQRSFAVAAKPSGSYNKPRRSYSPVSNMKGDEWHIRAQKLAELKEQLEKGEITEEEYNLRRADILSGKQ